MKRIMALIMILTVAVCAFAGCGKGAGQDAGAQGGAAAENASAEAVDPTQVKTVGEALALKGEEGDFQSSYSEKTYVAVISVDGVYYRFIADLPEDVSKALWDLDWDEERDAKEMELLQSVPIRTVENLSEMMPSQEEIDQWVGKTGQDLFDAGWTYWYYDLETMKAGMDYDAFQYDVQFEYDGEPLENDDDFDFFETFADLTVASVTYTGIGSNATNIEE